MLEAWMNRIVFEFRI